MKISYKKFSFFLGIIVILFLVVENFLCLTQPVINSGILFQKNEGGFFVKRISENSPAAISGIKDGMIINQINSEDISSWQDYLDIYNFSEYSKKIEKAFKIGNEITLTDNNGTSYTFKNSRQNIFKNFAAWPTLFFVRFIVSVFCVVIAMYCASYYADNENVHPLVISLVFGGIAIGNTFYSIWNDYGFLVLVNISFDVGTFVSGSALIRYISCELRTIKNREKLGNALYFCSIFPWFTLVVKYLLIFVFHWDIITNPISYLTRVVCAIVSFSIIVFHFYLIIKIPSQISVLFRFVMLSIFCAFAPLTIFYVRIYLQPVFYLSNMDGFFTIIPFSYYPLLVLFSILQYKGINHTKRIKAFSTILSFVMVMSIFLILPIEISGKMLSLVNVFILCLLSPLVFKFVKGVFDIMFSSSGFLMRREKVDFQGKLNAALDENDLFRIAEMEFKRKFDSSFVIFELYKNDGTNSFIYKENPEITEGFIKQFSEDASSHKGEESDKIYKLPYNCYCIPLFKGNSIFCRIFLGFKTNQSDYMSEEKLALEKTARMFFQTLIYFDNLSQTQIIQARNEKSVSIQNNMIFLLSSLPSVRERKDYFYSMRMFLCVQLVCKKAREDGYYPEIFTDSYISFLSEAASIHDIGKVMIPEEILKKDGKLSEKEFDIIKTHCQEGEKIIHEVFWNYKDSPFIKILLEVILNHHEKWNGQGYPDNLSGKEIPLSARIVSIVDTFDALVTYRCYRKILSFKEAFSIIEEEAGESFDPELVFVFLELEEQIINLYENVKFD